MSPALLITNNRWHEFEKIQASIFTLGQGICSQRMNLEREPEVEFNHHLLYGSWYDIQIIAYLNGDHEPQRYLGKGIFLRRGKQMWMSELTDDKYRDNEVEWICRCCEKANVGRVAICEHCHTNKSQKVVRILVKIPVVGAPFSIANCMLQWGKATQTNNPSDRTDAIVNTVFAVVDTVTLPIIIVATLAHIPAKVAAQHAVALNAKVVLHKSGLPLLHEFGRELGKEGIVGEVGLVKTAAEVVVRQIAKEK